MSDFWKGIALDWGVTIPSVIDPKDDAHILRSSIFWILLTVPGQRVMNPEFGSNLAALVFDPNDVVTADNVSQAVREAIQRWDDRIEFLDFTAESKDNKMICTVVYKQKADPIHDAYRTVEFELTPDTFAG